MVDPESVAMVAASYAGTKELLPRVLGPTADYIGDSLFKLSKLAADNLFAVVGKADRRLGAGPREGAVPPRVLKAIWDEAPFADEELTQDYLAGVLASSRSASGRDDRAAARVRLVGDLSNYTLRTHYLICASVQRLAVGEDIARVRTDGPPRVYITDDEYIAGMAFSESELADRTSIQVDALGTLQRIGFAWNLAQGTPEHLRGTAPGIDFPTNGILCQPTQAGAFFLAAACGVQGDPSVAWVGDPGVFAMESGPSLPVAHRLDSLPLLG